MSYVVMITSMVSDSDCCIYMRSSNIAEVEKTYRNILIMDLCTCWGICFSCMLSGLSFFFNCKRILNQQVVLDFFFICINLFLFVHLLVNLLQMDDGLEFSFTDKRRFAKIRLLDNVIVYSDYWKSLLFYLL